MLPIELKDGVVLLRAPDPAETDRLTELCQDPDVQEWTTVPSPYARAHAEGFLAIVEAGWAEGTQWHWGVRDAATGTLRGMIGLTGDAAGSAEIGYWLSPEVRGTGVLARAMDLVIGFAFAADGLGLDRLTWRAYTGNARSRRVAERSGFQVADEVRAGVQRGQARDEWVATLLPAGVRSAART
ncbi:GNAT family N-acetyltransferase [Cellulomonas hominis]